MRFLTSLFLLFFITLPVISQQINKGTVVGKVVGSDGQPAPDAIIIVKELNQIAVVNTEGNYKIENLNHGNYTLLFNLFGANTQSFNIVLNSDSIILDVKFEDNFTEEKEVVIEGKSKQREIEELGYAINVVNTKSVELQSIQANELLDRSTGVRVRQTGGLGSTIQYNINGLSGNSIRIFIDGIPISVYGPSFSLNSIPNTMIERIEVYKGVVPAYLSDDALGGAINVVLKKNNINNTLMASYSYGSFNTHQANINGGYRNQKSGFTARASGFYNYSDNKYEVWGDKVYVPLETGKINRIKARRFHDSYQSIGGKFDVGFTNVDWADQFLVSAVFSDMAKDIQHGATMEIVYGNRRATQNTQLYSLTYCKENFLFKGLDVSAFSTYSFLNRGVFDTIPDMYNWLGQRSDYNKDGIYDRWASGAEGGSPTLQTSLEKNFTHRLNIAYKITPATKINFNYIGTNFSRDQDDAMLSQAERDLIDTRYLNKSILSGAIESGFFGQRLKTSLFFKYYRQGVRLKDRSKDRLGSLSQIDYNNSTSVPGYGLALSYTIIPGVMVTGSAEKAVRLPEGTEVFGNSAENIDPSYELKPEHSQNLNLGLNFLPVFGKHKLGFVSNFFYRNTQNMIRQAVTSQVAETYRFENLLSVLSKGVDIEVNYNFNQKLIYSVGASIFNARFNTEFDPNGGRFIYYGNRLRNSPYFTSNSNLRYNLDNLFRKGSITALYYNLGYVHEFFRDWEGIGKNNKPIIPTQIVHDLGVAYTFPNKKLTISFDAKNILNRQVFDNWALQKPGRAFYIKMSYKII